MSEPRRLTEAERNRHANFGTCPLSIRSVAAQRLAWLESHSEAQAKQLEEAKRLLVQTVQQHEYSCAAIEAFDPEDGTPLGCEGKCGCGADDWNDQIRAFLAEAQ